MMVEEFENLTIYLKANDFFWLLIADQINGFSIFQYDFSSVTIRIANNFIFRN